MINIKYGIEFLKNIVCFWRFNAIDNDCGFMAIIGGNLVIAPVLELEDEFRRL